MGRDEIDDEEQVELLAAAFVGRVARLRGKDRVSGAR
jgi:hypothetical protein